MGKVPRLTTQLTRDHIPCTTNLRLAQSHPFSLTLGLLFQSFLCNNSAGTPFYVSLSHRFTSYDCPRPVILQPLAPASVPLLRPSSVTFLRSPRRRIRENVLAFWRLLQHINN